MRIHRHQRVKGTSPKKGEMPPTVKLQAKLQECQTIDMQTTHHTRVPEREISTLQNERTEPNMKR